MSPMIQAARRSTRPTSTPKNRIRSILAHSARLLRFLGPGLVTGAADDDPSGIATYSQIGAPVRLRHALDAGSVLSLDGSYPGSERMARAGQQGRAGAQHPASLSALAGIW